MDWLDAEGDATGAFGAVVAGDTTLGAPPSGSVTEGDAAGCGGAGDSAAGLGSIAAGGAAAGTTADSPVTTPDPRLACTHAASKTITAGADR